MIMKPRLLALTEQTGQAIGYHWSLNGPMRGRLLQYALMGLDQVYVDITLLKNDFMEEILKSHDFLGLNLQSIFTYPDF